MLPLNKRNMSRILTLVGFLLQVVSGNQEAGQDSWSFVLATREELANAATGWPLLGGRYETTSDVEDMFNLGMDIAAMKNASDADYRESIYRRGSETKGVDADSRSLAALSLNAKELMLADPFFAIYQHAFTMKGVENGEIRGNYSGRDATEYADTIISSLFERGIEDIQAEAAVVLNVWMAIVHELHTVVQACRRDFDVNASADALDRAAALWMSDNLMYDIAESAGERFGQREQETWVNKRVTERLNSVQSNLSNEINCSTTSTGTSIRDEIYRIINLMTIPLVQNLIHYVMSGENKDLVQIYIHAVLPQVQACDENLAEELRLDTLSSLTLDQKVSWIQALQQSFSCFRISCDDVGEYVLGSNYPKCQDESTVTLAGYDTLGSAALSQSRIDRDLVQVEIYLNLSSYDSVFDLYNHGYHAPFSLRSLVTNEIIPKSDRSLFDLYKDYFGYDSYDFVDTEISRILRREAEFSDASTEQISQTILGLLRFEGVFLSLASALQVAEASCWLQTTDANQTTIKYWDMSAALFIGSIEGKQLGGRNNGRLLYGASKSLCPSFDTCFQGNSRVNDLVLDALTEGRLHILQNDCPSLQRLVADYIMPSLQVILVQGTLAFGAEVSQLEIGSQDGSLGTVHGLSRSILPQIHEANNESARVIEENLAFNPVEKPVADGIYVVAEAVYVALPDMIAKCEDIGTLQSLSLTLCESPLAQRRSNNIAFGRYEFTTEETADQFASVALDVRDMATSESAEIAIQIYETGLNAFRSSYYRENTPITLASFSTDAAIFMSEDPLFNIFKFALYDDKSFEKNVKASFPFADEIVQEALLNAGDRELGAESAVVLNTWMMIAHHLYNAVRTCKARGNAVLHVDSAVALWIGKDQSEGSFTDGWLMYSIAQLAAKEFGHDEKEAAVNTQLMDQFVALQKTSDACGEDADAYVNVRLETNSILRLLSIPLIQRLLVAMAADDRWKVELYAASVVSQCAACDPIAHAELTDALYTEFSQEKMTDETVEAFSVFLRCMRLSCEDLAFTEGASQELQDLLSDICEKSAEMEFMPSNQTVSSPPPHLAPAFHESARIDLDILQIGIFMRTRAYEAAFDYYQNGRNAHRSEEQGPTDSIRSLISLQELATLQSQAPVDHLDIFSAFFGTDTYADELIIHGIQQTGLLRSASRIQLADSVESILQTMVSYQAVVWNFEQSIISCNQADPVGSDDFWNTGIALYLGSIDLSRSSDAGSSGLLLRSLATQQCTLFGACTDDGDSSSNVALFEAFNAGLSVIKQEECTKAKDLMDSTIVPLLQVPLIQGTLSSAVYLGDTSTNSSLKEADSTTGYFFAKSILPVIDDANTQSAQFIEDVYQFPLEGIESSDETQVVFDAIKNALPNMKVDCKMLGDIADFQFLSLCNEFHLPETMYSKIGLDVAEMTRALEDGRNDLAQLIYVDGKNVINVEGVIVTSLQDLSTEATENMVDVPLFNLFLHSINHGATSLSLKQSHDYANRFVQNAIMNPNDSAKTLAAEATVALSIWMHVIHMMNEAVSSCEESEAPNDVAAMIDQAAAFWIGDAEIGMAGQEGHLLYALASEMDGHFENDDENVLGVNQQILRFFSEAKHSTTLQFACSPGADTALDLHNTAQKAKRQMTIPLIQGLIHSLKIEDRDRVSLYAQAVIPMLSTCNPMDYEFLLANLVAGQFNVIDTEDIIDRLYGVFSCLGLKCSQVGVHFSDMTTRSARSRCSASNDMITYSGYRPADQDDFEKLAQIDRDLRELDILMGMEAYTAAHRVYKYGSNSETSLSALAQDLELKILPDFELYSEYFDSETYSHQFVLNMLASGSETSNDLSAIERRVLALRFTQMVLLPHAALFEIYQSASECADAELESERQVLVSSWDRAAALLLGSVDRSSVSASDQWFSPYDLAQEHCAQFGTCLVDDSGVSETNQKMIELLYAGRGAITSGNCAALEKISTEMKSLLLVPVIQATLSASLQLSSADSRGNESIAEAFASSRALLPLLKHLDTDAASTLEQLLPNLPAKTTAFNVLTGAVVASIFSQVYTGLEVDCERIGQTDGLNDPCTKTNIPQVQADENGGLSPGLMVLFILLGLAVLLCLGMLWHLRKGHKRSDRAEQIRGSSDGTDSADDKDEPPSATSRSNESLGKAPADFTMIGKSYRRRKSSRSLSEKANRALRRILKFDDDSTVVPVGPPPIRSESASNNNIEDSESNDEERSSPSQEEKTCLSSDETLTNVHDNVDIV